MNMHEQILGRPTKAKSVLMDNLKSEISAAAARLVIQEGLDYGAAKRRAVHQLGLPARCALPANDEIEDAVFEHIALFCADSQSRELLALRRLALRWMERVAAFFPCLGGAVWHGSATRLSDIYIQLFCDDSKSTEILLIDQGVAYEARNVTGMRGEVVSALSVHAFCADLNEDIGVHLLINDYDDLRGALRLDAKGRRPRGNLAAVRQLVHDQPT